MNTASRQRGPLSHSGGSCVTTPRAATLVALLGSDLRSGGITLSRDESRALARIYGFKAETSQKRPSKPERKPDPEGTPEWKRRETDARYKVEVTAWEKWTDPSPFHQAGADRNLVRHAEHDGLRLIAWLAKYVPEGEDPLKTLVQIAVGAGYDVAPEDCSWAEDESARV